MIMNLIFQNRGYKMTYWFNKELKNIISETYDRTHDSIYPCSMNFPLWHSGIHIDTNNSCIKNIISKGEIIASYINTDYINDTQSDSFILVKHCIKINKDEKFFYVLYSNLQPLKVREAVPRHGVLTAAASMYRNYRDLPYLKMRCPHLLSRSLNRYGTQRKW